MIEIIFGRGGSGKSYGELHIAVEKLRFGRQNIVTNLAINVPIFNAYLERHYPNEKIDLVSRLRILTVEETYEFWKYRGPEKWTGHEYEMLSDEGSNGVCYIIDEAGASGFSATGWAAKQGVGSRGLACLWYLDQQRKFGDDVFASNNGRLPTGIAKPFRDKAHTFRRYKNGYLAQYGPFKGRGRFEWTQYAQEPVGNAVEPIAKGTFEIGELASCYRTQDGVGVVGNNADIGRRAKGIPILWVIPAALVLGLLCVLIPWALGRGAQKFITGKAPAVQSVQATPVAVPAPPAGAAAVVSLAENQPVTVKGYVVLGSRCNVQLSDGRVLTEQSPELASIDRQSILLKNGQRLFFSQPQPARTLPAPDLTARTPAPREFPKFSGAFESNGSPFPRPNS